MTSENLLEPATENRGRPDSVAGADGTARRSVLRGALALGAVGLGSTLAGCGGGSSNSEAAPSGGNTTGAAAPPAPDTAAAPAAPPSAAAAPSADAAAAAPAAGGQVLGPAAKVVVGGGLVYDTAKVVVTQPTAGAYKAFSAICTHQQCIVDNVDGGTINCACHGSKYSITDGSVVRGPATMPLAAKTVKVSGDTITLT
jgi:Rieske Fe-S protein